MVIQITLRVFGAMVLQIRSQVLNILRVMGCTRVSEASVAGEELQSRASANTLLHACTAPVS
jgi:hypothetical protein